MIVVTLHSHLQTHSIDHPQHHRCHRTLLAYAPELNPDEQVWNRAKYTDLANFIPDDVDPDAPSGGHAMAASFRKTRSQQVLLRSFFQHAKLPLQRM